MKPSIAKKYRKQFDFHDILSDANPVLLLGLDLPFVVVTATSLRNAAALSLEMAIIHMVTMWITFLFARKLKGWQRMIVATIVSTATMLLARSLVITLFPEITSSVRIHLYLMAVNGMTLVQALFIRKDTNIGRITRSATVNILGFAGLMTLTGILREYFGRGTVWGYALPNFFKVEGTNAPFFGFILLGFLLVLGRRLTRYWVVSRIRDRAKRDLLQHVDEM